MMQTTTVRRTARADGPPAAESAAETTATLAQPGAPDTSLAPAHASRDVLYVRRVSMRTVVAIAAAFNAIIGCAVLFAGYLVIVVAAQHGVVDQVNSVTSDLGTGSGAHISLVRVVAVWTVIVVGWTVVMTAVMALGTLILNGLLELLGGIELDVTQTPPGRRDVRAAWRRMVTRVAATLQPADSPAPP